MDQVLPVLIYSPSKAHVTMGSLDKPILSEVRGEVFEERPSIWAAFAASVAANPDNLALACVHQPPGLFDIENLPLDDDSYRERPYLRWSFRSVHDAVLRLVRAWRALGVREGATLVTFMQNEAEIVLARYAFLFWPDSFKVTRSQI